MESNAKLINMWQAGVAAVRGRTSVKAALTASSTAEPDQIIAVGKAAASMALAADDVFGPVPMLVVTKYDHSAEAPPHAHVIESAHPVPDDASLRAGRAVLDCIDSMEPDSHLLMLVSGGASALVEALPVGVTLQDLATQTQDLLASGLDIHAMNAQRSAVSQIKAGKLLARFSGAKVTTLAISDVEGDDLNVIGSGIGQAHAPSFAFTSQIVASNAIARTACAQAAHAPVLTNEETLYEDVHVLAKRIGAALKTSEKGLHIYGGEPTVILPPNPGLGGRNMALALLLAREIAGFEGLRILVAGTDGTDGPTDAAGALVDGTTWEDSAQEALDRADAAPWLDARDALFRPGPTGTNVMDLLIAQRS